MPFRPAFTWPTLLFTILLLTAFGCVDDDMPGGTGMVGCPDCPPDEIAGTFAPTSVTLEVPNYFPQLPAGASEGLTKEGIALGRRLFYDPILSSDSTFSCQSCHLQELAFTDGTARSLGVRGLEGKRSAMSLANLAFNVNGFFWDGRAGTLERQAVHPVEDMLELNEDWDNVLAKIRRHATYPEAFKAAFGTPLRSEIDRDQVTQALAQFERTLLSTSSRFDSVVQLNQGFFTEQEEQGRELFFLEFALPNVIHPGCSHCHNQPLFGDNQFKNNGLDNVSSLADFTDGGRGEATGNVFDNGKFRTPTLRNIALTAPYMHDGRFATLEEVIDHYASGGHGVENEDPNITGFEISAEDRAAMVAFLRTLTDQNFISNSAFSDPEN